MNNSYLNDAVIVGGGPAGMATALMLAKRGWQNITVLEKRPSADYYEPDKSFSYQIDGRGQKFTDLCNLTAKLADLSVPSTDFYFTLIRKNGTRKTSKLPIADTNRKPAYWLPRASFVKLLYQEIVEHWQDSVRVLFQTQCQEIKQNDTCLEIIAESVDQKQFIFTPNLVVGCDGLNSIVRQTLHQWEQDESNNFKMQQFNSPSAGLKYKVLTLPPQFPLSEKKEDISKSIMAYGIRSIFKERKKAISLGLLPLKDSNTPRTANIITYPDHQIWQLKNPEAVENFFKQAFPQIPIQKMLSRQEIARFTASEGGIFPLPQYCSRLYRIWGQLENNQGTAVILLGDAVHCFPPDIGQGVNSALEDVYLLYETLAATKDNLSQALPHYQNIRQEDIKALIRLVKISYPWQYNQNVLQKRLWSINFLLRLLLNKIFPFLISPHSFLLLQQHELSYAEILLRSDRTTKILFILIGLLLFTLVFFKL